MKNNKGFAITATIYGFLVLFLIILLSVLSVMRSQNNRSITISEKIEDRVFPTNEIIVENQADYSLSHNDFTNMKRGKYYARIFKNGVHTDDNFFYVPEGASIKLSGSKLKINDSNAVIYDSAGNSFANSNIENVVITKYYVSK